ncbi:hypothetical protein [Salinarimonas sp.]|uniref:hypothetical protein n=1 Tax=Salinarimonas sp. TaxID=2766526 RepID=UPI0032D930CB
MSVRADDRRMSVLAVYQAAFPEPAALADPLEDGQYRLADFRSDPAVCERAMAEELLREPDLDPMGRGAYLVNRLAHELGGSLAALDLAGGDISGVSPRVTAYRSTLAHGAVDGEAYAYLETRVFLGPCAERDLPAHAAGEAIERVFEPLVDGVARACGLSRGALWRLVADNVANAYLLLGKEAGELHRATGRAEAVIRRPGSRLDFRQLAFLTIEIDASESPLGLPLRETFRERAGCCRYYTTARSEGAYCGTCVLRKDRRDFLRKTMIRHAADAEENGGA